MVITHVGPAHLEGLGDIEGVSVEKVSIAAGFEGTGCAGLRDGA